MCSQVFISILDVQLQIDVKENIFSHQCTYVEFPSELKQKTFIHGEFSIQTKLGFHFHRHQKSQSQLPLGSQKVGPCNTLPKIG